ncbi:hypothetical protein Sjap_003411 [Stephania japonica]|uniref:Cytochrome P450 n=1 Tax=Stephania japonica TaxID=461633 RepID=A0AAP0KNP8_9MAGN
MDFSQLWLPQLSLLLVLALPLLVLFLKQWKTKLNLPPGPPKLPIIGNLRQLGDLPHRSIRELSKTYGPVMLVHIGPLPMVVVSSTETAREIMKTQDLNFCTRPGSLVLEHVSYGFRGIAFSPHGDSWREVRKIFVLQLMSAKRAHPIGVIRADEVANMVASISKSASSSSSMSKPVDLTQHIFYYTATLMFRIALGRSYHGKHYDNAKFMEVVYKVGAVLGSFSASDYFPSSPIAWAVDVVTGLRGRLHRNFGELNKFLDKFIDEHMERGDGQEEDLIDVLLGIMRDQTSGFRITIDHVKSLLMDVIFGGLSTSAVGMVWAMTELARHPTKMKKVQEEIRAIVGKKGKVEESDLEQLRYLDMVFKETLRLHPPAPLGAARECIKPSKVNGYDILPGMRVVVNAGGIGRSPEYWDNPDEFRPERFEDSEINFKGQHFEFLPFGGGRRICPGLNMGVFNAELGLANLLYCFNWELPSGTKVDIDEKIGFAIHKAGLAVHKKSPLCLCPLSTMGSAESAKTLLLLPSGMKVDIDEKIGFAIHKAGLAVHKKSPLLLGAR